jgi:hypothetical protein
MKDVTGLVLDWPRLRDGFRFSRPSHYRNQFICRSRVSAARTYAVNDREPGVHTFNPECLKPVALGGVKHFNEPYSKGSSHIERNRLIGVHRSRIESLHFLWPSRSVRFTCGLGCPKGDIGIDGISKLYEATLTNYGPLPIRITQCDFTTDGSANATMVAYAVQRWDNRMREWKTLVEDQRSTFCRPYPLGIVKARLYSKFLWPGQSVSTDEEATAARDGFQLGDSARFFVFSGDAGDWRAAFPTAAFRIDQRAIAGDTALRVAH